MGAAGSPIERSRSRRLDPQNLRAKVSQDHARQRYRWAGAEFYDSEELSAFMSPTDIDETSVS